MPTTKKKKANKRKRSPFGEPQGGGAADDFVNKLMPAMQKAELTDSKIKDSPRNRGNILNPNAHDSGFFRSEAERQARINSSPLSQGNIGAMGPAQADPTGELFAQLTGQAIPEPAQPAQPMQPAAPEGLFSQQPTVVDPSGPLFQPHDPDPFGDISPNAVQAPSFDPFGDIAPQAPAGPALPEFNPFTDVAEGYEPGEPFGPVATQPQSPLAAPMQAPGPQSENPLVNRLLEMLTTPSEEKSIGDWFSQMGRSLDPRLMWSATGQDRELMQQTMRQQLLNQGRN